MNLSGSALQSQANENGGNGNGAIQICVIDSGIGLHTNNLKRIFKPFEQVESSTSRRFQGTGLGLSLCKQLVEIHGGVIWAKSDGEGKGATFCFTIPS